MRLRKRDGKLEEFDRNKIRRAMLSAFHEVSPASVPDVNPMLDSVMSFVMAEENEGIIGIEMVQDFVEKALMKHNCEDVAKAYIIYRHDRAKIRAARQKPDPNSLADYIHLAKYARYRPEYQRRESYDETVTRVEQMHMKRWPNLHNEIKEAFKLVYEKRILPSMRSMQFAGDAVLAHNARMYNCSFTLVDRPRVFAEMFYLLLCGSGVGFSVQWRHVRRLAALKRINRKTVHHFIVPDTIEGWADAVDFLINSYFVGFHAEFAYHMIRPEGALLKTSGGLAPGHLPLKIALESIRYVLDNAQGRKLRPIECHDIICYEAEAVLSGGIRRSSLISIFSPEDTEMMYAKVAGNFDPNKGINPQREMANNSAALLRNGDNYETFKRIVELAEQNYGDPGFYFTDNLDWGTNPCGEVGMNPTINGKTGFSFCNLCEINGALLESGDDLAHAAQMASRIGTFQAAYTDIPYLTEVTKQILERDALLGVGIMGMMDRPDICFDPSTLRTAADAVMMENIRVAKMIGINTCERGTVIKPGGTAPLEVGGIGSGIHPQHARRFFRRVTANPNEPIAQFFMKHNPHMVEKKPNGDWSLVFPVETLPGAITVKDLPALKFMENVFNVYENWIKTGTVSVHAPGLTHNVSCTVTVKPEEMDEVIETVWKNRHRITAMTFAPYLLDKIFPFAPREAVSTEADEIKWNYLIANYVPVPYKTMVEEAGIDRPLEPACGGGQCEVK